jgi:hypothetical protein
MIILKLIFKKWDVIAWTTLTVLKIGPSGRIAYCDEPPEYIKSGKFLD